MCITIELILNTSNNKKSIICSIGLENSEETCTANVFTNEKVNIEFDLERELGS